MPVQCRLVCSKCHLAFTNVLCSLGCVRKDEEIVIKMPGGLMKVTVLFQAIFQISAEVILVPCNKGLGACQPGALLELSEKE